MSGKSNTPITRLGTYADIVNDTEYRAKLNKYNLEFGEAQKPDENIKFRLHTNEGDFDAVANAEELNKTVRERGTFAKEDFEITKLPESLEK